MPLRPTLTASLLQVLRGWHKEKDDKDTTHTTPYATT